MNIDVLVIGSGGREYELARQLGNSSKIKKVYVAPGNAGTALLEKGENVDRDMMDIERIVAFVKQKAIPWVVVGPEPPLVAGIADPLRAAGVLVFGPSKSAARFEGSKAFSADFMQKHNIPQPKRQTAHSLDEALAMVKGKDPESYVLKADGLAAGKGVVLPGSAQEAEQTLRDMFSGTGFQGAGKDVVVIQERLHGPEVSAFAVSDGHNFVLLPFAQDHKRIRDNDEGPNTGGVGAYTPLPASIVSPEQDAQIHDIAKRSIKGMAEDGILFQGVLFIGLMLPKERGGDPVVIEYNVRFGDPEFEPIAVLLSDAGFDVADMLLQASKGDISGVTMPDTLHKSALTICLSAKGYPEEPRKGDVIHGLDKKYQSVLIHYAGTKQQGDNIVTAGGRVLYVTGFGDTADEAAAEAYAAIGPQGIHFDGMQYRTDIGYQIRSHKS